MCIRDSRISFFSAGSTAFPYFCWNLSGCHPSASCCIVFRLPCFLTMSLSALLVYCGMSSSLTTAPLGWIGGSRFPFLPGGASKASMAVAGRFTNRFQLFFSVETFFVSVLEAGAI
eukprot:TRINITY_DN20141_c0_g1_i1.p1 TRINITY_DN20141_c0_g1~~TRINITY_DN20141_c0_g1_i1.p1  ORF type:complete len:116 (-),score=7.61 TRINITY_DN20141_c0_g1_i1:227-574(-)